MRALTSCPLTDEPVVLEVAAVAATAVRGVLVVALRAAEGCRCRQCRDQAVRTFTWATLLATKPVVIAP